MRNEPFWTKLGFESLVLTTKGRISKELKKRMAGIRAIFCEADGILTNGKISFDTNAKEYKQFHVKDSTIIPYLRKSGIITGVISARESDAVNRWCADLKMEFCHQGILDKVQTVEKLAKHYRLKLKEVAFIGGDLSDLGVFRIVGLSVAPGDAPGYIRKESDLVTVTKGGGGVFRELADIILTARGELKEIIAG